MTATSNSEQLRRLADTYRMAQAAIAELKAAVLLLLASSSPKPMTNAEIGRALGIYGGHGGQHQGHISRTLLEMLREEELVTQSPDDKSWTLRSAAHSDD